jgi:hypothetical protein
MPPQVAQQMLDIVIVLVAAVSIPLARLAAIF